MSYKSDVRDIPDQIIILKERMNQYGENALKYEDLKRMLDDPNSTITMDKAELEMAKRNLAQYKSDYKKYNQCKKEIEKKEKQLKEAKEFLEENEEVIANSEGHIYPVAQVLEWTNKLKNYNKQLDLFVKKIEDFEYTVNQVWVAKKVKRFCAWINFALARLRYYIIKGLNGIYKKAREALILFEPLISLSNGNIGGVVTWINDMIKIILKPYQAIIQFIKDFAEYTPPLVEESVTLIGKLPPIPFMIKDKFFELLQHNISTTLTTVLNNINIKMQPITLDDIMSGNVEKPKKKDFGL